MIYQNLNPSQSQQECPQATKRNQGGSGRSGVLAENQSGTAGTNQGGSGQCGVLAEGQGGAGGTNQVGSCRSGVLAEGQGSAGCLGGANRAGIKSGACLTGIKGKDLGRPLGQQQALGWPPGLQWAL